MSSGGRGSFEPECRSRSIARWNGACGARGDDSAAHWPGDSSARRPGEPARDPTVATSHGARDGSNVRRPVAVPRPRQGSSRRVSFSRSRKCSSRSTPWQRATSPGRWQFWRGSRQLMQHAARPWDDAPGHKTTRLRSIWSVRSNPAGEMRPKLDQLLDIKDAAQYGVISLSGNSLKGALRSASCLVEFTARVIRRG